MVRVAVIDEDEAFLELTADILTGEGIDVSLHRENAVTFDDVVQAAPDLVVLDVRADQPRTLCLLKQLTAERHMKHVPVVACMAAPREFGSKLDWLQSICAGILPKPFDLDELLTCVHTTLCQQNSRPTQA